MKLDIPDYDALVAAARRRAPSTLLPTLARLSNEQLSGRDSPGWPHPWTVASVARECIAHSNEHRSTAPVTARDLARLRQLGVDLRDPYADQAGQPGAADSMVVRYLYQQVPYTSHELLGEVGRLIEVCQGDDAFYGNLGITVVSADMWTDLLGMSVLEFARAAMIPVLIARDHDGWFEPAWLADPAFATVGVSAEQVLHVFHHFMAAELADLRQRAKAGRNVNPALRRLDFNPLVETPFVGIGAGRYVAPSMHLAEHRLSLAAIYYLGMARFGESFASDMGKLIEAYVGRQLSQLDYDELVPELPYGTKRNRRLTCDWVLSIGGVSTVFEVKAARIAQMGRLGYEAHLADVRTGLGKALEKQIPATGQLIRGADQVFAAYNLPTDVHGVVVTAEPHLMINSQHYRTVMPDPGCPYVVLSLRELEWFVGTVLAGVDAGALVPALTATTTQPESVMSAAARAIGVEPGNPLILRAFERATVGLATEQRDGD